MNQALDPAIVALAGGSAALAGLYASEHRRDARMRQDRVRHDLVFPLGATESQAAAALSALSGAANDGEFVLELRATAEAITHHLHAPADALAAIHQIEAALPGLRTTHSEPDSWQRWRCECKSPT